MNLTNFETNRLKTSPTPEVPKAGQPELLAAATSMTLAEEKEGGDDDAKGIGSHSTEKTWLEKVKVDVNLLRLCPDRLKKDFEAVFEAVSQSPDALMYVHESWTQDCGLRMVSRSTRKTWLEKVEADGNLLRLCSDKLSTTKLLLGP